MRKVLLYLFVLLLLSWSNNAQATQFVASPKRRVVVIDAGHGGASRPGAVVNNVMEKDINLKVSLLVYEQLKKKMPELKVILTRSDDTPLHASKNIDNYERPKIANSNDADLFVSIHSNWFSDPNTTGAEVIVLSLNEKTQGHTQKRTTVSADNEDYIHIDDIDKTSLAYIEALSLLMNNDPINRTFGEIVGSKFRAKGRRFRGVKEYPDKVWTVLYPLRMPGVIIEIGFMSNPAELTYINSASGQQAIASAISDSIVEYFTRLEQMTIHESSTVAPSEDNTTEPTVVDNSTDEGYTIQIMASATQLTISSSRFGELHSGVNEFLGKGTYKYKYCYGRYATFAEAKAEIERVRSFYGDAYIVQYKENELK
ncbi:MAG: N-acetylmuramoyl-L-alanine amidase [Alistipes sp.]|nr:N-acetylmuramoyl-L-alanine amidase [Alistipes sp.]